jgi:hypothetical protein
MVNKHDLPNWRTQPFDRERVDLVRVRRARYISRGPGCRFLTVLRALANVNFGPALPIHPEFQQRANG